MTARSCTAAITVLLGARDPFWEVLMGDVTVEATPVLAGLML
jgi:hypothetical protein